MPDFNVVDLPDNGGEGGSRDTRGSFFEKRATDYSKHR